MIHQCVGSRIRLDHRSAGGPAQPIVIEPPPTFQLHGCTSDRSSKERSYILPDTLKPTAENRGMRNRHKTDKFMPIFCRDILEQGALIFYFMAQRLQLHYVIYVVV